MEQDPRALGRGSGNHRGTGGGSRQRRRGRGQCFTGTERHRCPCPAHRRAGCRRAGNHQHPFQLAAEHQPGNQPGDHQLEQLRHRKGGSGHYRPALLFRHPAEPGAGKRSVPNLRLPHGQREGVPGEPGRRAVRPGGQRQRRRPGRFQPRHQGRRFPGRELLFLQGWLGGRSRQPGKTERRICGAARQFRGKRRQHRNHQGEHGACCRRRDHSRFRPGRPDGHQGGYGGLQGPGGK